MLTSALLKQKLSAHSFEASDVSFSWFTLKTHFRICVSRRKLIKHKFFSLQLKTHFRHSRNRKFKISLPKTEMIADEKSNLQKWKHFVGYSRLLCFANDWLLIGVLTFDRFIIIFRFSIRIRTLLSVMIN